MRTLFGVVPPISQLEQPDGTAKSLPGGVFPKKIERFQLPKMASVP